MIAATILISLALMAPDAGAATSAAVASQTGGATPSVAPVVPAVDSNLILSRPDFAMMIPLLFFNV